MNKKKINKRARFLADKDFFRKTKSNQKEPYLVTIVFLKTFTIIYLIYLKRKAYESLWTMRSMHVSGRYNFGSGHQHFILP